VQAKRVEDLVFQIRTNPTTMADSKSPLPPGWDMKFDARTGKYYYINHYTKTTSWEDPRERYQQIGKPTAKDNKENQRPEEVKASEHLPMQCYQASSSMVPLANQQVVTMRRELEAENLSAQSQEFRSQRASSPGAGRANTPQMGTSSGYGQSQFLHATASPGPLARLQLDNSEMQPYESPLSQRSTLRRDSHILAEIQEMESSYTNQEQVEFASRYLKSVFPTVEEYLLLDVLANSENNVQKAADKLVKMGYVKRETPAGPRLHAKKKEEERLAEKRTPLPKPPPIKTEKEKEELRKKMKDKYEKRYDIPERILFMALESVLYDEEQANNLVTSMIEDDIKRQKAKEAEKMREKAEKKKSPKPIRRIEAERPKHTSPKHVPKPKEGKRGFSKNTKIEAPRISQGTSTNTQEERQGDSKTLAKGPNPTLRKGPNDDLLLTDYVTWNGPNPEFRKGANRAGAKGPNPEFHKGPGGGTKGPSSANRKGAQGLAKGSIYGTLNADAAASRAI
jgi:hypothetical protein